MMEVAARSGFELVTVGVDRMDAHVKELAKVYTEIAKQLGLGSRQ